MSNKKGEKMSIVPKFEAVSDEDSFLDVKPMLVPGPKVYRDNNVIYFLDDMDSDSVYALEKHLNDIIENSRFASSVNIVIDSLGGHTSGVYDIVKNYPLPITTWVRGYCCSAATVLFLAGTKRYISPTSLFLIHSARTTAFQEFRESEATDMQEMMAKHNEVLLMNIYKKETKIPKKMLEQIPHKELWLTPEQCVEYKIANAIKTFSKYSLE